MNYIVGNVDIIQGRCRKAKDCEKYAKTHIAVPFL